MSHPPKKAKTTSTSGGPFAKRPRVMLVRILEFFTMYEVARLQRLVCLEFRDAGQDRIHERGGRKLYEEGMAHLFGLNYKTINRPRARLLLQASLDAGCKIALLRERMRASNPSNQDQQKILHDLKVIATSSPYKWVDYYIGRWYANGWGGEEKIKQTVAWFKKAIRKGHTNARYDLGVSYDNGDLGLTHSRTKANELWALDADQGHAYARFNLGNSYREGRGDLAIDFNRCVALWEQSAKQGVLSAQFHLARLYCLGSKDGTPMTIPMNSQLSFKWNLAAAKQRHVKAMMRIGLAYRAGRGVVQNHGLAVEWYTKAAELGDGNAQTLVGRSFEKGIAVAVDLVEAVVWYKKAAAQGNQGGIDGVERLAVW